MPETVTAAFYEGHRLIITVPLDRNEVKDVLVADSGKYFVVVRGLGGCCFSYTKEHDPFLTIYKADGSHAADAARQWKFRRSRAKVVGEILFHFDLE